MGGRTRSRKYFTRSGTVRDAPWRETTDHACCSAVESDAGRRTATHGEGE